MIRSFWVIDRAGVCIYRRSYVQENLDPELFSAFSSTMMKFAQELGHSEIQNVKMADQTCSFSITNGLLFMLSDDQESVSTYLLEGLQRLFFRHFQSKVFLLGELLRDSIVELKAFERDLDAAIREYENQRRMGPFAPDYHPKRTGSLINLLVRGDAHREELVRMFGIEGLDVITLSDGSRTIQAMAESTGLPLRTIQEVIKFGIHKDLIINPDESKSEPAFSQIVQDIIDGRGEVDGFVDRLSSSGDASPNRIALIRNIRGLQKSSSALERKIEIESSDDDLTEEPLEATSLTAEGAPQEFTTQETSSSQKIVSVLSEIGADIKRTLEPSAAKGDPEALASDDAQQVVQTRCPVCREPLSTGSPDLICKNCNIHVHLSCALTLKVGRRYLCQCPNCGHRGTFKEQGPAEF